MDILGEGGLVAPPGGQHQQLQFGPHLAPTDSGPLAGPATLANQEQLEHQQRHDLLFKHRSANIVGLPDSGLGGQVRDNSTNTSGPVQRNFLDRLTSVELLFLTSSLMFLVLLALGLLGSYYCFRRQSAAADRRAGAILRRKRRYLGPTSLYNAPLKPADVTGGALIHRHHHHQHYGPSLLRHHYQIQQPPQVSAEAPSSPESDVSGQVLLQQPAGARHSDYSLRRPFAGHHSQHYSSSDQQYRVGLARPVPILGRRETVYAPGGQSALGRAHRGHHLGPPGEPLHQPLGRQQPALQEWQQQVPGRPVVKEQPLLKLAPEPDYARGSEHLERLDRAPARARSMQQLQQPDTPGAGASDGWWSLTRRQAQVAASNGRPRQATKTTGAVRPQPLETARQHRYGGQEESDSSSSDTEAELTNNEPNEQQAHRPRIFLKSIEDSYITNFTEIQEQEYVKRDSRRPLSWAQWRARQANANSKPGARGEHQQNSRTPSGDLDDDDDQSRSIQANLRSLTELDVNFAKSLLVGRRQGDTSGTRQSPVSSDDQEETGVECKPVTLDDDDDDNNNTRDAPPLTMANASWRVIPEPQVARLVPSGRQPGQQDPLRGTTIAIATTTTEPPKQNDPDATAVQQAERAQQSPDLVISPEYEVGAGRLRLASSPASARDSVSYV